MIVIKLLKVWKNVHVAVIEPVGTNVANNAGESAANGGAGGGIASRSVTAVLASRG